MGKKKKFIDKKKSATFQLMARDSSDPFFDGTPGSEKVFIRVDENPYGLDAQGEHPEDESNSIFADAPDDVDDLGEADDGGLGFSMRSGAGFGGASSTGIGLPEDVRKEIIELGFPDDGYNYLHHLREIKNTGGGSMYYENPKAQLDQIPGDVKAYDASRVRVPEVKEEDKVDQSLYSIAAKTIGARIQKVVDPEVAALLDYDSDMSRFGSDIEDLEEDFVVQANLAEDGGDDLDDIVTEVSIKPEEVINGQKDDWFSSGHQETVEERATDLIPETRPRRLLDERFDKVTLVLFAEEEYGTDEEDDDDCSYRENEEESLVDRLKLVLRSDAMDAMELDGKYRAPADILRSNEAPESEELLNSAVVLRRCAEYAEKYQNEDDGEETVLVEESSDESDIWDCETIVTTYSNLDNHPGKIEAQGASRKKKLAETFSKALNTTGGPVISLHGKEKLPIGFLPGSKKTCPETVNASSLKTEPLRRKQHGQESKDEKKERKAAVKEERREARRLKKETKVVYKCEAHRAQRVAAISGPSSINLG
ncbi:Protein LTV1 homolog [Linum perenne]